MRPRVTQSYKGTAIGTVVGGLLGGPIGSILVGAGLGALAGSAANPTTPLALDAAFAQFFAERQIAFGGMERLGWNRIRVVFGRGANFFYIDVAVPPDRSLFPNVDALEDALYDKAVLALNERMSALGLG